MAMIDPYYVEGRLILCYVYLLICGDDKTVYVKVGMSQNPLERATALRNTSPLPIDLMATVDMQSRRLALDLECDLHKALQEWRIQGEWFRLSYDDKEKFKVITRVALEPYATKERPLNWTKINLKEIASQKLRAQRYAKSRWKRGSLAYRDAVMAGLRR